ncbi:unnamed protein product, partial [Thelazia callipaeda]|uniref:SCP domain-containing protein n=1 Tax=Thelazia callipaeda TaxID=103827 RepID=A0A0N5D7V5_THECL
MSNFYKLKTKCAARAMQLDVAMRKLLADNQLGTVTQQSQPLTPKYALINAALLETTEGYKYVGMVENRTSAHARESYDK